MKTEAIKLTIRFDDSKEFNVGQEGSVLVYDPRDHTVGIHSWVGTPTTPSSVWHNICVEIGVRGQKVGLASVLRDIESTFDDLRKSYKGSRWDGSNHIGNWSEYDELVTTIEAAIEHNCPNLVTDFPEWFCDGCHDWPQLKREAIGDAESLIDDLMREAEEYDARFYRADVAEFVADLAAGKYDEQV